jgi:hypothetical protein
MNWPVELKFLIVLLTSTLLSLAFYFVAVRYTFIGKQLNGVRYSIRG